MFKLICALLVCGILGFGVYMQFSLKHVPKKEIPYLVGATKAGEPCRIISKWGNGSYCKPKEKDESIITEFLRLNTENDEHLDEYGLRYDCFLDIDTQEYKFVDYEKTEKLGGNFKEKYLFENRDESADCTRFQYVFNYNKNMSGQDYYLTASGECTEKPISFQPVIFASCISTLLIVIFMLIIIYVE